MDVGERPKKLLFQRVIVDRLSRVPPRVFKKFKNGRKNLQRNSGQMANAKHLSTNEGTGNAPETPAYFASIPFIVVLPVPKESVSMPMRCSMVTKRLPSGSFFF